MDVLSNRQTRDYTSISRYASFPFYYNKKDNKYIYGITANLVEGTDYILVKVKEDDTLESLSLAYYSRPDYYWIIADFNRIQDPLIKLSNYYKELKVPSLSYISFEK